MQWPPQSTAAIPSGTPSAKSSGPKSAIAPSFASNAPGLSSPLSGSSRRALT